MKNSQLYKKKKKRTPKNIDGKVRTVEHLYWEMYFKDHPEILKERELTNIKSAKALVIGKKKGFARVYDELTVGEQKMGYAALFAATIGFISLAIIMT